MVFASKFLPFLAIISCFVAINGETCGSSAKGTGLIIGGTFSEKNQWPWLAALMMASDDTFFCGGTLISKRHVLTAAHCLQQKGQSRPTKSEDIIVYFGKHNLTEPKEHGSIPIHPARTLIHSDWKYRTDKYDADVALIFFEYDIGFTARISPICMTSEPMIHRKGTVAGWGKPSLLTDDPREKPSTTPKHVEMSIIDQRTCFRENSQFEHIASERTFCGKAEGEAGPCLGDSGSGFYVQHEGVWFIVGITSASLTRNGDCDVTKNAVFTNISIFADWINKETEFEISTSSVQDNLNLNIGSFSTPAPVVFQTATTSAPTIDDMWKSVKKYAKWIG